MPSSECFQSPSGAILLRYLQARLEDSRDRLILADPLQSATVAALQAECKVYHRLSGEMLDKEIQAWLQAKERLEQEQVVSVTETK